MGQGIISVRKVVDAEESFDISVDMTGWGSNPPSPYPIPICLRYCQRNTTSTTTSKEMGGGEEAYIKPKREEDIEEGHDPRKSV